MAHYALLNEHSVVVQVITGKDEHEGHHDWERFYSQETGFIVKRTSYNTIAGRHTNGGIPFRKNYAGIGYTYDAARDAFIPPKPSDDATLDEATCQWIVPSLGADSV